MEARVSKNLMGTLSLPSISKKPFGRNAPMEISLDQYWSADVQSAILKKYLVITKGEPKAYETTEIVKVCSGTLPLPLVKKVLRDTEPFKLKSSLLDTFEFKQMLKKGLIKIVGKNKKKAAGEKEERVVEKVVEKPKVVDTNPAKHNKNDSLVWDAAKKADAELEQEEADSAKKVKRVVKKAKKTEKDPRSLIIDTDAEDDAEMHPDVEFIDDETKQKIKNHPILGKKKYAVDVDEGQINWVDVDDNKARIKDHPILGKKK